MKSLNQWVYIDLDHATYVMAEDLGSVEVYTVLDGRWELATQDGALRFDSRDSVMTAADTYIKARRAAWRLKWLYQGGRDITPVGEWFMEGDRYYKSGTGYVISVRGDKVAVSTGGGPTHKTTSSIENAIKDVNEEKYPLPAMRTRKPYVVNPSEAHNNNGPLEYTVKRPTHLAVGQVWRFGVAERMVTALSGKAGQWGVMHIGDNNLILDYGSAEYVGKVTIE